jgi:Putative addiction module component
MGTRAIEQMSWEEKLRALEALWDAITREGDRYESPAWHEQELKETQERHQADTEESLDWARAKRDST